MTVEQIVIHYLEENGNPWKFGGTLEDYLRSVRGTKGESTSRILRYMSNDGVLEREYEDTGHGRPNVKYRLKREELKQSVLL